MRPLPRPVAVAVAGAVATLALAACGGQGDAADRDTADRDTAADATVTIRTFSFQPDPLEVAAGTTITFVNDDAIDHTVTAGTRDAPAPERFDGRLPTKGATFELTLDEPGTYEYFCTVHPGPGMTAVIHVTG